MSGIMGSRTAMRNVVTDMANRRSMAGVPAFVVFVAAMLLAVGSAAGEVSLIGGLINVPAAGTFAPAVEYNSAAGAYLVVWRDVTDPYGWECKAVRVDTDTGSILDTPFYISDDPGGVSAITARLTFNSATGEWFIVYQASQATVDGGKDDVFGQRIAADGQLIGGHLELVRESDWQNAADVAYDPSRNRYLVVWQHSCGTGCQKIIRGRVFDAMGAPVSGRISVSDDSPRNKHYPKVAYSPVSDEYMVAWSDYRNLPPDYDPDVHGNDNKWMDIYGQRVAADGVLIGGNLPLYVPPNPTTSPNGQDAIDGLACNTSDGSYAVGLTKLTAQFGWTTLGFVMDSAGTMLGSVFNLSHPEFGAQATPAYNSADNTYYISYETGSAVSGKQVSVSGIVMSAQETIVPGLSVRNNDLAARPGYGQFLQVAVSDSGVCVAQRFTTGEPVTEFGVTSAHRRTTLAWVNPSNPDFVATLVRFRTDTYPLGPTDGTLVADKPNTPGSSDSFVHTGLTNGTTYYYAAFAHNIEPRYAPPARVAGTPILRGDFEPRDGDVDQEDFGHLQSCLVGSGQLAAAGCEDADLDGDLDVDQDDCNVFQSCISGTDVEPDC